MEKWVPVLWNIISIVAIVTVPFQLKILKTLKKNGIKTSILGVMPSDLKKFQNLINSEKDESIRFKMRLTYLSWIIAFIIGLTSLISVILIHLLADK